MAREQDRSFGADTPVARYWLVHCEGFRVEGSRGRTWIVERVSPDADAGDVLHVKRDGRYFHSARVIPATRVASIDPWKETIVLRRRERRGKATASRAGGATAAGVAVLALHGRNAALAAARAAGRGAILFLGMLAAGSELVVELCQLGRRHAPEAGRRVGSATRKTTAAAGVYAAGAARRATAESKALATRATARRAEPEVPPPPTARGEGAAEANENGAAPTAARPPVRRSG